YVHFMAIARGTELPLMLYSIPSRCGIEIGVETFARLAADAKNIVAIKEAGGTVDRVSRPRQVHPDGLVLLSGDDSLNVPIKSEGASGVVSVASNLVPGTVKALVDAALAGDYAKAGELHRKYYPLFTDIFVESNPVPIKAAMAARGWMTEEVRPPLAALLPASR